ncbi:ABC transporter permease [Imtechella halotolerans]|uniref:ABC transporter involved in lipoprotein release permease n=1 Tax=Imtechella halotolerans K1 TaxID=946077 RepID=I0WG61_9FLAO|nr:ABC transporter permease [Imtechella halotolerans]EID75377.1 ABC transporter involved in lipoprotein release permease [Imtechella halotolerans K1]WMQ63751.1 FtsX-like permease family protein [Imtechella halotolerans]
MMLLKLAWLNIWRNKRRTIITATSVFFAVLLAIVFRSLTDGIYDNMIHNVVSYSSGYLQIHKKGYWDEQSIDNSFEEDQNLYKLLLETPKITHILPRIQTFSLASNLDKTKGVLVLGIDPVKEKEVNRLQDKIVKGDYIESVQDNGVVVGEGLASQFKLKVNDTLVLLGQGYHASSAAGKYRVKGIIKLGSIELNNNVVYMSLQQAQQLLGADKHITSISVILEKGTHLNTLKGSIQKLIGLDTYEVMSWKEMMPELDQFIEADSSGHYIIIGVLYLIIAFGLFGTILMMVFERQHEFGILIAIGMKRALLALMLLLESIMISLIGCFLGIIGGIFIVKWFTIHPIQFTGDLKEVYEDYGIESIIYFSSDEKVFFTQTLIVLVLSTLLALYSGYNVMKLKPVEAINS